jgi:hypothetical protein
VSGQVIGQTAIDGTSSLRPSLQALVPSPLLHRKTFRGKAPLLWQEKAADGSSEVPISSEKLGLLSLTRVGGIVRDWSKQVNVP